MASSINLSISLTKLIGDVVGEYLLIGFPSESIKNLVKFHFIAFPSVPGRERFKCSKIG